MKSNPIEFNTEPFETVFRSARLERVVDGDTIDLLVDLGFDVWSKVRVRLMSLSQDGDSFVLTGVDTPEIRGEERPDGLVAKNHVWGFLGDYDYEVPVPIRIYSQKGGSRDKYGRWLAAIVFEYKDSKWYDLGSELLAMGMAEVYE